MAACTNIAELARFCKVSPATVSRVFSGAATVGEKTRTKILAAARDLNYAPQQTARKNNVAIVIPSTQAIQPPSWFAGMLTGTIMQRICQAGFVPQLIEPQDIAKLLPNFTVAALAFDWRETTDTYAQLAAMGVPLIGINNQIPGHCNVCTDHAGDARLATRHLLERGHRRIGWLDCVVHNWGSQNRLAGYREALAESGVAFDEALICPQDPTGALAPEGLSRILRDGQATALICLHEDWVMQLHYYLQVLGYSVPIDVSVVAAEIPGLTQWMCPPWTCIEQDLEALSDAIIERICRIDRKEEPDQLSNAVLSTDKIIERRSVKNCI